MPTILVIDDDALTREAVSRLLEHEGYRTVRAANGKDGWATLYDRTPDLVLLDLMMPQMDGVTFLQLLRRSDRWGSLPVIVLTGRAADDRLVRSASELGVQDTVAKASSGIDDLLDRVRRHLPAA